MKTLEQCRYEIDEIDDQLMHLFEKRMNIAKEVVLYKQKHQMNIFQPEREKQVVEKNVTRIQNNELKEHAKIFVQEIMNISKTYQSQFVSNCNQDNFQLVHTKDAIVGFQGIPGSFSEQALCQFFGENTIRKHYYGFKDVFEALKADEIQYGIVPLENSSTGAINDNYDLIRDYGFYIVAEQSISISQHLLGIRGSVEEDISEVYSHPQGLLQTSTYLQQHPDIHQKECSNTAMAAKLVAQRNDKHIGAIASIQAAKLYGLDVLKENIQNQKSNTTRFIIFSKNPEKTNDASCVSVVFTLPHQVGALYHILKILNDHQINMLHIESRPLAHTKWQYYFYLDFEGNLAQSHIQEAICEIKVHSQSFQILGHYAKRST